MYINNKLLIGKNDKFEACIIPKMANRHGMISGASGSGKTVTLKVMAESFSNAGIPVFMVDVKGDLAATAKIGEPNDNVTSRVEKLGLEGFDYQKFPTTFWDVYGESGHPIRTTVTRIGPKLLSKMLNLSEAQEGVLTIVFKICKDEDLEIIDLKDLRSALNYVGEKRKEYILEYGNINTQSIGSIQRNILSLQEEGGDYFFGKPDFEIKDFIHYDGFSGKGYINILHAAKLFQKSNLYSTFLLWLLTELYNTMPEVGDLDRPKLVFFIDEAHLLFNEMPSNLLSTIVQIVKLIRSKGIGIYFISQSPSDVPDEILSQLGNRVQHVLRYYTKSDEKAIKAAANSFRENKEFNTEEEIKMLSTGQALVSFQTEKGEPDIVQKVTILPPQSMMGTITDEERKTFIEQSYVYNKYEKQEDPESAFEKINGINQRKAEEEQKAKEEEQKAKEEEKKKKEEEKLQKEKEREEEKKRKEEERKKKEEERKKAKPSKAEKAVTKVANSTLSTIGRKIGDSLFKSLFK